MTGKNRLTKKELAQLTEGFRTIWLIRKRVSETEAVRDEEGMWLTEEAFKVMQLDEAEQYEVCHIGKLFIESGVGESISTQVKAE